MTDRPPAAQFAANGQKTVLLALAAALVWRPAVAQPGSPAASEAYPIGVYDELAIDVRDNPDLSRWTVVRPDGFVSLPLAEDVPAAGRTAAELAQSIAARLDPYVPGARVSVGIVRSAATVDGDATVIPRYGHDLQIIGGSRPPQTVPYRAGMRLIDAMVAAGGVPPGSDGSRAVLVRNDPDGRREIPLRLDDLVSRGDASADLILQPGDVIVVPEAWLAGEWQRKYGISLWQVFTDNYRLDPDGEKDPALISAVTPAVQITGSSARVTGALSAAVTGQYIALDGPAVRIIPNIVGTSSTELVRDTVFVDAQAIVSELSLNAAAPTLDITTDTQSALVQTYQVSPRTLSRLRDVGYLETIAVLAGTIVSNRRDGDGGASQEADSVDLSDSVTTGGTMRLFSAPERASRLGWAAQGGATRMTRMGTSDVTVVGASAEPTYAVTRWLSVALTGGWGLLDDGRDKLQGPEIMARAHYAPSPRAKIGGAVGWRLQNPAAEVAADIELGPRTALAARYRDSVGVGQALLVSTAGGLGYDAQSRGFIDRGSSLPFSSNLTGTTISDTLTRTRRADIDISHRRGEEVMSAGAFYVKQQDIGSGESASRNNGAADQTSAGVTAQWSYPVGRTTSLIAGGAVYRVETEGADGATSLAGLVRLTVAQRLTEHVTGFMGYQFRQRFSDNRGDRYREQAVLIGVSRTF